LLVFDIDIRGGKTELAAELLAFDDGAEGRIVAAEQGGGLGEVAAGDRFANERAADDFTVDFQWGHAIHGKIVLLAHFHEQVDVAFPFVAKIPSVTDRDAAKWACSVNELLDEIAGGCFCRLGGERAGQQAGDADLSEDNLLMARAAE